MIVITTQGMKPVSFCLTWEKIAPVVTSFQTEFSHLSSIHLLTHSIKTFTEYMLYVIY